MQEIQIHTRQMLDAKVQYVNENNVSINKN